MERVLELIRADVAEDQIRIDNPTQNLESYFLEVVAKARQSDAQTSGAQSGGQVAAYLRGEAEAKPAAAKVLERLSAPAPAAPGPATAAAATPAPAVDQARLASLAKPAEPAPTPAAASPAPAAPSATPADLAKANEKLASLLKKPGA
jgi:hypothetical protein